MLMRQAGSGGRRCAVMLTRGGGSRNRKAVALGLAPDLNNPVPAQPPIALDGCTLMALKPDEVEALRRYWDQKAQVFGRRHG